MLPLRYSSLNNPLNVYIALRQGYLKYRKSSAQYPQQWITPYVLRWRSTVAQHLQPHRNKSPKDKNSKMIKTDISVEQGDTLELKDDSFLRVKNLPSEESPDLEGWQFVRNAETLGLPKLDQNEVYWVFHLSMKDSRPAIDQALVNLATKEIVRKRRMLLTNTVYPGNYKTPGVDDDGPELFCRWKHVFATETGKIDRPWDAFSLPAAEITEASFERLRAEECDDGNRVADELLRESWLGINRS
ncbi:MAG: hypothetical protein Q9169_003845 [Polycauliona sp. 2 TL-2023]